MLGAPSRNIGARQRWLSFFLAVQTERVLDDPRASIIMCETQINQLSSMCALELPACPPTDPVSTHRWAMPPICLPLRNYDNTSGSEHTVVQPVALLRNCSHMSWRNVLDRLSLQRKRWIVGLHRADGFVRIRVERLMKRVDSGHAVPLKHTQQARLDHLYSVKKRAGIGLSLAVAWCRMATCSCAVQVVRLHRYVS